MKTYFIVTGSYNQFLNYINDIVILHPEIAKRNSYFITDEECFRFVPNLNYNADFLRGFYNVEFKYWGTWITRSDLHQIYKFENMYKIVNKY